MTGYALVTGASSGIGVDLARELARRQFDLILTARRRGQLEQVREAIRRDFPVDIVVIANDLDTPDGARHLYQQVRDRDLPVRMLVNNAGLGHFGSLLDQTPEMIETTIRVNVGALALLTRLFAGDMKDRGGGYILNNASFAAIQPTPQYGLYSGTKGFVLAFSQSLRRDLRTANISVSALCPGFFRSDFMEHSGQQPGVIVRCITMDPARVARAGIAGVLKGKAVIVPGAIYKSLNLLMRLLPRTAATRIADFAMRV